jgi:hypothetical protein
MNTLPQLLGGATVMACAVIAVFFLRFWRVTGDRFFVFFAVSFLIMGAHWTSLALTEPAQEFRPLLYGARVAAFLLIAAGIVDKNRRRPGGR